MSRQTIARPAAQMAMLCSRTETCPPETDWVATPKWDGWRALALRRGDRAAIFSRHGTALTDRLHPDLRRALDELAASGTAIDGELVLLAEGPCGITADFDGLGRAMRQRTPDPRVQFVAFDVMAHEGRDVRGDRWEERHAILTSSLERLDAPPVALIDALPATPCTFTRLVGLGFEGAVYKRRSSRYTSGRSRDWLKHKARHLIDGVVITHGSPGNRPPRALVDLGPLGHHWVISARREPIGSPVRVAYARRDADGTPRDAFLLTAPPSR